MNDTHYAEGITAQNLRAILELWEQMVPKIEETMQTIIEINDKLFDKESDSFSWCHLYELPVKDHINFNFPVLLQEDQMVAWCKQITESPGKITALPDVAKQVDEHFETRDSLTEEEIEAIRPFLHDYCAYFYSIQYSLLCLLYHGCFLNELIDRVRSGDDEALFDAIRIDPTIIGCQSVNDRISKARRLRDQVFLDKLRKMQSGVTAKLKQANFQQMRLIFRILSEAGATRLSNDQLYQLFVEELKLYTANSAGGGVEKSLRKFADTYMKQYATT
ncbi:hypothetical protein [Nitrosomonas oligotropha]|uniref:Uncharacterized protein n=1 Tax=Nitrosomonas oligotropha TaxID=42354 RepID=A0A1H8V7R3_9PROT|nr:hypothetical protein [Nitrosomonas oligotropha]SDX54528.1 hypothetical protein SAMN05216300_14814 [Nitrosomonas oligotropha]SEP10828.1 hypothetical protein SAMN05216333_14614 [Nitrosomonas oligotropha]